MGLARSGDPTSGAERETRFGYDGAGRMVSSSSPGKWCRQERHAPDNGGLMTQRRLDVWPLMEKALRYVRQRLRLQWRRAAIR